ncbi:hypothetical protein [Candidatus Poriferisodalis sp.]|uniref:hypothetical protein n=1 Tax=Candidatus Poriferisodalis sp. TaxID=3101277 RepID=UPI003B525A4C
MPKADYYEGLTLPEVLRAFADHHSDPRTRHITADETALLYRAADRLEQITTATAGGLTDESNLAAVTALPHRAVGG